MTAQSVAFTIYDKTENSNWLGQISSWLSMPKNVVASSIQTYSNQWGDLIRNDEKLKNDYNIGQDKEPLFSQLNTVFRPKSSFVFHADLENQVEEKSIYEKGFYSMGIPFDLVSLERNVNNFTNGKYWVKATEVTKYSPNGEVLEELDALDNPSAALYGSQYGNNVPVMVCANAKYGSFLFRDYEGADGTTGEAHSGIKSLKYTLNSDLIQGSSLALNGLEENGDALLRCWIKGSGNSALYLAFSGMNDPSQHLKLTRIAEADGWVLFSTVIERKYINSDFSAQLTSNNSNELSIILIDDLRLQPLSSSANCFVYDATNLRLLTQFDDQHFGTFYQYNAEGKLVRKIVETERGKRTIQENSYNVPKVARISASQSVN